MPPFAKSSEVNDRDLTQDAEAMQMEKSE